MCRYLFILTFSILVSLVSHSAFAQTDTTATDTTSDHKVKKPELAGRQLCIGVDYFHPIINYFIRNQYGVEIAADYYTRNEYYLVADGGFGGSTVSYTNLSYTTTNSYLRFGFNKTLLPRDRPADWDKMFIGLSVAGAEIARSVANYTIVDSLWGSSRSSLPAPKPFPAIWAELDGGVRVELGKGICAGWTVRGKFMLNGKSFNSLSPQYIAGYGQGDKNTIFDIDMYISYAIRWKRAHVPVADLKTAPAPDASKPSSPPGDKKDNK